MSLQTLTYIVVGASFALYIAIAFKSKARRTGDFLGQDYDSPEGCASSCEPRVLSGVGNE